MAGRMEFQFQFRGPRRTPSFGAGQARLRLLLLGDWSGRGQRGVAEPDLARRPLLRIDLDSFDQVMARLAPRLILPATADERVPEALALTSLDHFHPDHLCRNLEVFAGLQALRARLLDASTFASTADALEPPPSTPAVPPPADTLERLLGGKPRPAASEAGPDMGAFLRQVVAPHITPAADARQPRLVAAVDEAAAQHLRGLLHQPSFQRLEAAWRALHRLVTSIEDETTLFLLDVSREELAADLAGHPDGSGLHQRLADPDSPWSLIIADEIFGPGAADLALLSALGAVAAQTGAPVIAAVDPHVDWNGLDDEAAARWQSLRQSPQACAIGLALPRWLVRLPYGPKTDPIESFPFDELGHGRAHESYLWGNPAFACALLAAAAFRQNGADMQLGDVQELEELPCHTFREEGESRMQPCAEVFLGERKISELLDRGLIPLVSARDRNALRVPRFQSIADPPSPLEGPWGVE